MIYLELIWGFLKVGSFSFGGAYSAIPLIRDVVLQYGWLSDDALTQMIAVSESTPGPIMVNLATYVGSSQAGLLGAILATTAVVLPSFLVILLVMQLLDRVLKNKYVQAALKGVKPCIAGIILATGAYMLFTNCFDLQFALNSKAAFLTCILLLVPAAYKKVKKKKLSPISLILLSAFMGLLIY